MSYFVVEIIRVENKRLSVEGSFVQAKPLMKLDYLLSFLLTPRQYLSSETQI